MPEITYREAVRDALGQAMRKDEDVFIMGEDIAEMGGSMAVTQGLLEEFGPERVRNTPISEMAIVGAGIGAAMAKARSLREGRDERLRTIGTRVRSGLDDARQGEEMGNCVEERDPRTLQPPGEASIGGSLNKTRRAVGADEAVTPRGFGARV